MDVSAGQADMEKSFLPLQKLWIPVCKVTKLANQWGEIFMENIEEKPPYGEEWR